jgi:insecticidal toxin
LGSFLPAVSVVSVLAMPVLSALVLNISSGSQTSTDGVCATLWATCIQVCYKGMDVMNQYQGSNTAGKSFLQYFRLDDIQALSNEFRAAPEYEALVGYYSACAKDQPWADQMAPLLLLKETLDSLIGQRAGPISAALADLSARLENYTNRLVQTVRMLNPVASEVPKIMHFVWVGGSAVGAIQRDYINIWKAVMVKEGHTFNLWYDSDAVLAFEMNRVILESARRMPWSQGEPLSPRLWSWPG